MVIYVQLNADKRGVKKIYNMDDAVNVGRHCENVHMHSWPLNRIHFCQRLPQRSRIVVVIGAYRRNIVLLALNWEDA